MFRWIVFLVSWFLSVTVITSLQCQCTCTSPDNPEEKYVATMDNNTFTFNAVKMNEEIALNRTEMVNHRKDKTMKERSDKTIYQTMNTSSSQQNAKHQQYKLNNVWNVIGNQQNKKTNLQKMDKSVNHKEGSYNVWGQLKTGVKTGVFQHGKSVGKGHIDPNNSPPHMYQPDSKSRHHSFESIHQPKGNTMYRNSNNWMQHKNRNNNILEFPAWKPFTAQRRTPYGQTVNTTRHEFRHAQWTNQVQSTNANDVEIEPVEREVR
ncbi:uncharacterized protein LOC134682140 [Mytilus trossulus]|uniref:uncharacterized protein LOC134682140 n=1 Tax=Mytilus trossulus TaxID=6551 RepID=UPI00300568B0